MSAKRHQSFNKNLFLKLNQESILKTNYSQTQGEKMNTQQANFANPIADLISDEIYELLQSRNLINEKTLRDYQIKRKFKQLRNEKVSASDAIEQIRQDYPYLQFDSIRKIIYLGNKQANQQIKF